ncbi:probable aminoacyl tRNA synthase complex-interacting multifunctional protein 2 isoform X2 [Toxorhynchites rutilus septentrionalis]|uniref:probable aminoacyl tRNA synthase complex-interacting multifunctional protein 2 isoform X2 n=1 Tax=Toxorhynchites rutilus septentrionalis TaxID=329112 RepID=UPI002478A401|nr:probable aminoacyl tRNA synthase complex-interacting multifunctional protein 2 isoform X2 [Toxorhynchites rutilus septentrionalis]
MYDLKPILKRVEIELPTCMYPMKPLINESNSCSPAGQSTEDRSELQILEDKQEKILKQLAELREQLLSMRTDLKICSKPPQPNTAVSSSENTVHKAESKAQTKQIQPINLSYLQDFVVNASPENIPFGLLALKKLWIDRLNLNVECFIHSTIPKLSEAALNFQKIITNLRPKIENLPTIKVTLIWKNVGTYTEMITSPTAYVPICGEVNILRFLSRCGPSEFNYEQHADVTEVDSILDTCYLLINKSNPTEKKQVLKTLSTKLGKTPSFGGAEISLCDIAATSAIKQVHNLLAKDVNPNMAKLVARVSSMIGV